MSTVVTTDYRAINAAETFTESLRTTGFGVLTNHPVSLELLNQVFQGWESFFASQDKHNFLYDKEHQDGYFPFLAESAKGAEVADLKEFFHFYPWGRKPTALAEMTESLYQQLHQVATTLLNWIEACTPAHISTQFSEPLSQMIAGSKRSLLRVIHYPPLQGNETAGAIRAAAHGDINLITVLPAATAPGLEALDSEGNWHEIPCNPGNLVVNVGDMLELCSNGYYRSTLHQVTNPKGDAAQSARLSMPLFLHPRDDVRLSPHHTGKTFLFERLAELGLT